MHLRLQGGSERRKRSTQITDQLWLSIVDGMDGGNGICHQYGQTAAPCCCCCCHRRRRLGMSTTSLKRHCLRKNSPAVSRSTASVACPHGCLPACMVACCSLPPSRASPKEECTKTRQDKNSQLLLCLGTAAACRLCRIPTSPKTASPKQNSADVP